MYKPKYEIIKCEKQTKSYKDVKIDDVALFEFGDDNNWVRAVIKGLTVEISEYGSTTLKIDFEYLDGTKQTAYDFIYPNRDATLDIIGKAKVIDYSNEEDMSK